MKKSVKVGSGVLLYTLIVLGIVTLINLFAVSRPGRFDMTPESRFSLSAQSDDVIKNLQESITIYAFVKDEQSLPIRDLLEQYASSRVTCKITDPDKDPVLATTYKITDYQSVIIKGEKGRVERISQMTEEAVTNAIIRVTSQGAKKAYFLTGHDERAIDDKNPNGWSDINDFLTAADYQTSPLNWFAAGGVPEDADLLIIAGPRIPLLPEEIDRLDMVVARGVPLLLALDPDAKGPIIEWAKRYGITFEQTWLLDPVSQEIGFNPLVATITNFGDHPIVKNFTAATFFPVARSLSIAATNEKNATVTLVGSTAPQSWGETDWPSIERGEPTFVDEVDLPGPQPLIAVATLPILTSGDQQIIGGGNKQERILFVGDSDFAANATLGLSANKDLTLNMFSWLVERDDKITIRPKTRGFNPIMFTSGQLWFIFGVTVFLMPALAIVVGILVRIRRRQS